MAEFPPAAGYPVGGNSTIKYYVVQMHYSNPSQVNSNKNPLNRAIELKSALCYLRSCGQFGHAILRH